LLPVKKANLAKLNEPIFQASNADRDALHKAFKELERNIFSLKGYAFGHFGKLLCPTLYSQRKNIIKEECKGDTCVKLKGKVPVPGVIRGYVLDALKTCYMRVVKFFGPQYFVKRIQWYMGTNIAMNIDVISHCQEIGHMPYHSCPVSVTSKIVQWHSVWSRKIPLSRCAHMCLRPFP
jgi:hypothetical protein